MGCVPYKTCLFKSLDLVNKAENALWPLGELISFSDKDWWFIQYAGSNALEAKLEAEKKKKVGNREEMRERGKKGRKGNTSRAEAERRIDGRQDVMEVVACQSSPLSHAETDAFDHSESQA